MTALIPFDYSGRQVRTVQVDGEPGRYFGCDELQRLPGRPPMPGHEGHVYVVEFANALVKVGMASDVRRRIAHHESVAEAMDRQIARVWVSPLHAAYAANEQLLIQFGAAHAERRIRSEYFVGCEFDRFVRLAQRFDFAPLDRDAKQQEIDAKAAWLRKFVKDDARRADDYVTVSRAYVDAAEQWMALTNGITPNGAPRPALGPVERSSYDECLVWAQELADATGQTVDDVFEMSWIDMIAGALEAKVGAAVMQWRVFAVENNRTDMTRSCYEAWGAS